MSGPAPAVAAIRVAVRQTLTEVCEPGQLILVACSGGADSLALAAATAFEAPKLGLRAGLVTIDHGLQAESAQQAAAVISQAAELGLNPAASHKVTVAGPGGLEAAARKARYAGLKSVADTVDASWVLLGHTLDDQAETVLLGLGRGSGPRSIAGMQAVDPPWLRPLLSIPRSVTEDACEAAGLAPWDDPHNKDSRFRRVRLRHEVLPLLDDVLGGGVAAALGRTATMLQEDLSALDSWVAELVAQRLEPESAISDAEPNVSVTAFTGLPTAIRRRLVRAWLGRHGRTGLTAAQLIAVDDLLADWHGQGLVALPHKYGVVRRHGRLHLIQI